MQLRPKGILVAIILASGLAGAAQAQDDIKAQPVTVSAAVGNDQSDFFFTANRAGAYVVFSGAVPYRTAQIRSLYSVRMSNGLNTFYTNVARVSPLRRLASYVVPTGTQFNTFLTANQNATFIWREVFNVPGRGIFQTVSGGVPLLLHVGTAAAPITGAALRFPEAAVNTADETPLTQEYRVILGGAYPRISGAIAFESAGSARTTAPMRDTLSGKIVTGAQQFTTWNNEAYFVGTNPNTSTPDIYKVNATQRGRAAVYSTANVTVGTTDKPQQLTGSGAGLFYTTLDNAAAHTRLVTTADGSAFTTVKDDAANNVADATQFTPSINPLAGDIAFSAFDPATSTNRLALYQSEANTAFYAEFVNTPAGSTTDPQDIVSTGNYYYFSGLFGGVRYLCRAFTGDESIQAATESVGGTFITNPSNIIDISDTEQGGAMFFTGDATINGTPLTGILFALDVNDENMIATPCKTPGGAYVVGATHLRAVTDHGTIFRCYFSAPVNTGANAEFAGGKDLGTKPFVVTTP